MAKFLYKKAKKSCRFGKFFVPLQKLLKNEAKYLHHNP